MSKHQSLVYEINRLRKTLDRVTNSGIFNEDNDSALVEWHQLLLADLLYSTLDPLDVIQGKEIELLDLCFRVEQESRGSTNTD